MDISTQVVSLPDGTTLAYDLAGQGPPLVLVSGLGGLGGFWAPIRASLATRFHVLTLDQRGLGRSSRGVAPISIQQLAHDVAAAAAAQGWTHFALAGHSTGAAIAMTLAAENPAQVTALALSGGWLHADRYIEQAFALRLQVLRQIGVSAYDRLGRFLTYPPEWLAETGDFGPQDEPPPQEAARLRQVWEERIAALLAYDGRGLAPRLACPALVLGAVDDALIPHAHQQATAAAIPGARLVSLPGGGHFFPVTRRADYAAALLAHLPGGDAAG
jgi:pimeloyl-ACP methyl ester carboxylesterase